MVGEEVDLATVAESRVSNIYKSNPGRINMVLIFLFSLSRSH